MRSVPEIATGRAKFSAVSEWQLATLASRRVTVIEFVSPTNKRGKGLDAFLEKRNNLLAGAVSVVEIDLIRSGDWRRILGRHLCPPEARSLYRATIRVPDEPMAVYLQPIFLRQPLPSARIPLRQGETPIEVELQRLLDQAYHNGRHAKPLCLPLTRRRLARHPIDDSQEAHRIENRQPGKPMKEIAAFRRIAAHQVRQVPLVLSSDCECAAAAPAGQAHFSPLTVSAQSAPLKRGVIPRARSTGMRDRGRWSLLARTACNRKQSGAKGPAWKPGELKRPSLLFAARVPDGVNRTLSGLIQIGLCGNLPMDRRQNLTESGALHRLLDQFGDVIVRRLARFCGTSSDRVLRLRRQ